MLHDQDFPKFSWGEETDIFIYIQNRSPHKSLDNITLEEEFTKKKPSVDHLQIFGYPVYIHIPKDKRKKLDPTNMKGTFVGYSNTLKAYMVYKKEGCQIEVRQDVIFVESIAFKKSKDLPMDSDDEELPIFEEKGTREEEYSKHEDEGPNEFVQHAVILESRNIPNWLKSTLLDAEGHGASNGKFREIKKPKRYSRYAAYMTELIEVEPSTFEEVFKHEEWKDSMNEEYKSIMKNEVWEIVPRPEDKSMVTSKQLYKIKHAIDGSIDKYKAIFVARGFSQQEGIDYEEKFAPTSRYTIICSLVSLEASMGWNIHQMDVKIAFMNDTIDEEVYIEKPFGFEVKDR